jgi:hypothetical protein
MANKVFRVVQDKLNSLTTSQLERYGEELSGKLALVIFDKEYGIVETTFQPGVITFTSIDYEHNKKIFTERGRAIGDKSIMFDVRHKSPPYHYESWERIDLAFEGDYVLYKDEYAKITEINEDGTFSIKTTESEEEYTFCKIKDRDKFGKLVLTFDKKDFSDLLVEINQSVIRAAESQPQPEPQPEKTPKESGQHMVEFMDGEVDFIDRSDFCVIGDKVITSSGEGRITNFDVEQNLVFLQKENGMNFHCFANEVVDLVDNQDQDDQDQDDQDDQDDQEDDSKICKSVTLYEQLASDGFMYSYTNMLFFGISDSAPEIYNYYLELRKNCKWIRDKGEDAYYFQENDYQEWMTDLDEKIFKFMILKIKNDPSYFEINGYERYYYDKLHNLFSTISSTNKIITGETDDSRYVFYAIADNLFDFYVMLDNTDQNVRFEVSGDRIKESDAENLSVLRFQETLFHLLKDDYVIKDVSETDIYKKMKIFINLVQA